MFKFIKLSFILTALLLTAFAVYAEKHPEEIGNADCMDCHAEVTPEIAQEWEDSVHGLTGVKCGVCHGDEFNFRKVPAVETCRSCHAAQVENNVMKSKSCSSCHPTHSFNVHRQQNK